MLEVSAKMERTTGVISLAGYIAAAAETPMLKAYDDMTQQGAKEIRLHCSPGIILTSTGIAVLISIVSKARKRSQRVTASGLSEHYKKIFTMIGLSDYVVIEN